MARGDIFTNLVSLANNAVVDRQPAGGVEEMALDIANALMEGSAPNQITFVKLERYNGAIGSLLEDGDSGNTATTWFKVRHVFDNTNYMRVTNKGGSTSITTHTTIVIG